MAELNGTDSKLEALVHFSALGYMLKGSFTNKEIIITTAVLMEATQRRGAHIHGFVENARATDISSTGVTAAPRLIYQIPAHSTQSFLSINPHKTICIGFQTNSRWVFGVIIWDICLTTRFMSGHQRRKDYQQ